jgi:acyl-coenzyme A thioesterase PaaI-like protein
MTRRTIRGTVSGALVATAINYVMVLIVTATAAAIMVQAVSATVTAKFLAIATVLKRTSF